MFTRHFPIKLTRYLKNVLVKNRYQRLTSELKANVNEAVHQLLANFDEEFPQLDSRERPRHKRQTDASFMSSDDESSIGDSSLNQVFLISLTFKKYYDNLVKYINLYL